MVSATNEGTLAAVKAQAKKDARTNSTVLGTLMRTVDGRRWLWLRLGETGVFHDTENFDLAQMAYRAGKRSLGLRLLADITRLCPREYIIMTAENTGVQVDPSEEQEQDPSNG